MLELLKALIPYGVYKTYRQWKQKNGIPGYKGLDNLDKQIIDIIRPREGGYFIELGANDGVRQSNTYVLQYLYNWTGILIEPNPKHYYNCIKNRSFRNRPHFVAAACVPFGYKEKFVEMADADLMSISFGLHVNNLDALAHARKGALLAHNECVICMYGAIARSLQSIIDECGEPAKIDFLSIDVEGNEAAVLKGIDFNRSRPIWILVELRSDDHESHQILIDHQYKLHSTLNPRSCVADYLYQSAI
jgi:FkbM family methyltransferase